MNSTEDFKQDEEQSPLAKHKLHDYTHLVRLYSAEHVGATEFINRITSVDFAHIRWTFC